MSNFSERLLHFIENQLHMSVSEFEKKCKFPNGTIQRALKGTNIGIDKVQVIGQLYPSLNLDWLLNGDGNMIDKSILQPTAIEKALLTLADSVSKMAENTSILANTNAVLASSNKNLIDTNSFLSSHVVKILPKKAYKDLEDRISVAAEP